MKKHTFTFQAFSYYSVMSTTSLLLAWYLLRVVGSFAALTQYQEFMALTASKPKSAFTEAQHQAASTALQHAIRADRHNLEYQFQFGHYLHEYTAVTSSFETLQTREAGYQEALHWLQQALLHDPANATYYYELGRLHQRITPCTVQNADTCATVRYFATAVLRDSSNTFLRRSIVRWLYQLHPDSALDVMNTLIRKTALSPPSPPELDGQRAQFFYDIQLDYQSDLRFNALSSSEFVPYCPDGAAEPLYQTMAEDGTSVFEFGNDDGGAEWCAVLSSERMRVKKVLCLPDDLEAYREEAMLKILMNNGGNGNFTAQIFLDDRLIKAYHPSDPVPRTAAWYTIPFDKTLLEGKSSCTVYVRGQSVSNQGNSLQIWGDRDTPTTRSTFNVRATDDLSAQHGVQTGEYMIRLVLQKK